MKAIRLSYDRAIWMRARSFLIDCAVAARMIEIHSSIYEFAYTAYRWLRLDCVSMGSLTLRIGEFAHTAYR